MLVTFASFCANPLSSGVRQERQMLAVFIGALGWESLAPTGKHEGLRAFSPHGSDRLTTCSPSTNVCRSFRAGRLLHISNPGFRFAPPWAEVYYAFGVFSGPLSE